MTVNTGFFRRMGAICLMAAMIGAGCARADAVVVTAERLNIRSEATADSRAVTVVSAGETLKYVCEADDWIMVSIGSKTGYVMKKYVDIDDDKIIEDVAGALSLYTQSVTGTATARLNVRELPMSGCTALKVAGNGDSLELLGECGDWYRVNYGGKTGYVLRAYVTKNGDTTIDSGKNETPSTPAQPSQPESATDYATAVPGTATTRVNLRAEALPSAKVLKVIGSGDSVSILGEAGSWYKVSWGGRTGYASAQYIRKNASNDNNSGNTGDNGSNTGDSTKETDYAQAKTGETTARVNLRAAASTSAKCKVVVASGTSLTVVGEAGSWYHVHCGGYDGYIAKSYVKITGTSEAYVSWTGVTDVEVNLRAEPEGEVLRVLKSGTELTVTGQNGSWYQVKYSNTAGYVASAYVSKKTNNGGSARPDDSGTVAVGTTAYVTGGSVNVRKGAGTNYGIVDTLRTGTQITVYEQTNGWYRMTKGSLSGYIAAKYVTSQGGTVVPDNPSDAKAEVILSDWWTGEIQSVLKRGGTATVTDVDTGISFQIKRTGGNNHADAQPLTSADTALMLKAYGGKWAWTRRAIWVTVNGKVYAASMNGMPHGESDSMPDNDFDGCFCIHFLNSRTHAGNRLDAAHQAAVKKASQTAMK